MLRDDRRATQEPGTTAARVLLELVAMIRHQRLREGDQLPHLPELVSTIGAARDTVRSAIAVLADVGVLQVRVGRNGGTWVKDRAFIPAALALVLDEPDDPQHWAQLLEVRYLLQVEAARLLAQSGDPAGLAEVRRHLSEMDSGAEGGDDNGEDRRRRMRAATELNCAIALACGNDVLAEMLVRMIDRVAVLGVRRFESLSTPQFDVLIGAIHDLVTAIENRDDDGIADAVRRQMALTLEVLSQGRSD